MGLWRIQVCQRFNSRRESHIDADDERITSSATKLGYTFLSGKGRSENAACPLVMTLLATHTPSPIILSEQIACQEELVPFSQ
jgi:hypothetical protein